MKLFILHNEDIAKDIVAFYNREEAFSFLKLKADSSFTFQVREVEVFEAVDKLKILKYYHASCNLGDSEITVEEHIWYPEVEEDTPTAECTEVTQYGARVACSGTDIQQVGNAIRKHIAKKRYEFEYAVRKVCNVVQPKIENNEAMTVNMIVDESEIDQDTVVKILILLKKEGFLDIVDPVETMAKTQQEGSKTKLWTPAQEVEPDLMNVAFDKRGSLIKKDPNKGLQAKFPIQKNKRK